MAFRIYYSDGSVYGGCPSDAPVLDALLVVEDDRDHGRRIVSGGDYMVWERERWWAVDQIGMIAYLVRPGWKKVLIGRMVENERFSEIWRKADSDEEFPTRTAFGVYERDVTHA